MGGVEFSENVLRQLITFGLLCERSSECRLLSNVHLNIDQPGYLWHANTSIFDFRKFEVTRIEMNNLRPPIAENASHSMLHEYSILQDQFLIVDALYQESPEVLVRFLRAKNVTEDIVRALHNREQLEAEFLIAAAQGINRYDIVPTIVRCFSRGALPKTELLSILADALMKDPSFEFSLTDENKTLLRELPEYVAEALAGRAQEFDISWIHKDENKTLLRELPKYVAEALAGRAQEFSLTDENKTLLRELPKYVARALAGRVRREL